MKKLFSRNASDQAPADQPSARSHRYKYPLVLISLSLMAGASMGLCVYAASAFYQPLSSGLNISLGSASMITTLYLVFMAIAVLGLPMAMKKISYKNLLVLGVFLAAGGALGISFSFNVIWVYIFSALMGVGGACFGYVPVTIILNNWFYSRNSLRTSLALACPAVVGALFSPLFTLLIEPLGWRMAFVLLAILILLFNMPAMLINLTTTPQESGLEPHGIRELNVEPKAKSNDHPVAAFAALAIIAILAAVLLGLPQQFPSYATSLSRQALLGATMMSCAMIGNIVFKLLGGLLGDKLGAIYTTTSLTVVVLFATFGLLISVWFTNDVALEVMAFLFGSAYALSDLSMPLLTRDQFGRNRYPRMYSIVNFLSTLAMALSISMMGYFYDAVKTWTWVYVCSLIVEALILVLILALLHNTTGRPLFQHKKKAEPAKAAPSVHIEPLDAEEIRGEKKEEEPEPEPELKAETNASDVAENAPQFNESGKAEEAEGEDRTEDSETTAKDKPAAESKTESAPEVKAQAEPDKEPAVEEPEKGTDTAEPAEDGKPEAAFSESEKPADKAGE